MSVRLAREWAGGKENVAGSGTGDRAVLRLPSPFYRMDVNIGETPSIEVDYRVRASFPDQQSYDEYVCATLSHVCRGELQPQLHVWLEAVSRVERRLLFPAVYQMTNNMHTLVNTYLCAMHPSDYLKCMEQARPSAWLFPPCTRRVMHSVMVRLLLFMHQLYSRCKESCITTFDPPERQLLKSMDDVNPFLARLCDVNTWFSTVCSGNMMVPFQLLACAKDALLTAGEVLAEAAAKKLSNGTMNHQLSSQLNLTSTGLRGWMVQLPCAMHCESSAWKRVDDVLERKTIEGLAEQMFSLVIVEYPESYHVLDTLRFCLQRQHNHYREELVVSLLHALHKRLLHVGVETRVILSAYASAVDSLKVLDPTCVLMHRVCRVIKEYLKKRPDTVRQIITYITTEKREELGEQLVMKKGGTIVDDEEIAGGVNDEWLPVAGEQIEWTEWMPDPPDAPPGESGRFRKTADVFNMLVSVYGSKEMFVKEYRQLLAERLASTHHNDTAFELKYLELLKLRFSEGELQQCEVMLKDVRESQRIDRAASLIPTVPVATRIISSHFWPKMDSDKVEKLPDIMEKALEEYANVYKQHKASRHLNWMRSVGCVELDVMIDGVRVEKVCSNAHAAVLYPFTDKEEWQLSELCDSLAIPRAVGKRRLEWWQAQGVLLQNADTWRITPNAASMERSRTAAEGDEDEAADEGVDGGDGADALEQYWTYTKNFIANHEQNEVRAERMHRIYKMFASPSQQGPSLDTVVAFLNRKVKLNLLSFHNGFYRVVKEQPGQ